MSQAEALASHWVLLFFLGLLNKYMLVWSIDYGSSVLSSERQQDTIHRTWSEWTLWSACSRTCGGGVRMRTRVCNLSKTHRKSDVPKACVGETVEYELCSVHNCSPFDKEFLEYQCSLKNGQSVGGRSIQEWIPYRYGRNPCELQCWSKDRTLVHTFGKMIDGTKCATSDPRQAAVCINGRCTPVDCAGQIGLDNNLDRCGVCRGNNSTCVHFRDIFWKRPRVKTSFDGSKDNHYDYEKVATIPAGATEIVVKENSENNFLALMDHKGQYQVNGNWRIQSPGHFSVDGSEYKYNRTWDGGESLSTSGPTRFDVVVYVLGSGDIPTVQYEYWISTTNPFKPSRSLQILNQVKHTDDHEIEPRHTQPENSHIHDASAFTKKPTIPRAKYQGYKSYYHRNEILRSVPSWSIKRHRPHKNNMDGHFPPKIDVPRTHGTDYINENTRFVPFDNRHVPTSSDAGKENVKDKLTNYNFSTRTNNPAYIRAVPTLKNVTIAGEDDLVEIEIPSSNRKRYHLYSKTEASPNIRTVQTKNQSDTTASKLGYSNKHEISTTSSNRKRYDSKQRNINNIESPRKRHFENNGHNVNGYGRPTTTMAQTRNVNGHRTSFVTLQPMHLEKNGGSVPNFENENRKHVSNGACQPCPRPKHQKKSFCTSDFVLKATVLSSEKQEDSIRYELEISQSYKNKVPISSREYIWTTDSCRCPKLRNGKEYILMGYSGTSGNRRESRLLISRTSFVRKYSQKRARNMLRLVRDQKKLCNNLKYRHSRD